MRLSYVVYNERPDSGLMRTQVYSLLREIARQDPDIQVELISFWQPWVARKFRREIAEVRSELQAAGIRVYDMPWAWIPSRYFLYKTWLLPVLCAWVAVLFACALRGRRDIVHCRGYLGSFVAARLARRRGYRTIFDMRSLWPKEHVTIGVWRTTDTIYKVWRWIEADTLRHADAAIGVSQGMVEEVARLLPGAESKIRLIPIAVDTTEFVHDAVARQEIRAELGWSSCTVIAYQGSLGLMNSNLAEVAQYFVPIMEWFPEARFLILTSNTDVDIEGVLESLGVPGDRFAVRRPRKGQLARWLSAADAGIHAMSEGPDSGTRMGVKVVEYLSCGLPIIVNPHVGAAASLAQERGVGVVIDLGRPDDARQKLVGLFAANKGPRQDCRELAEYRFSVVSCARRYRDVYRQVLD